MGGREGEGRGEGRGGGKGEIPCTCCWIPGGETVINTTQYEILNFLSIYTNHGQLDIFLYTTYAKQDSIPPISPCMYRLIVNSQTKIMPNLNATSYQGVLFNIISDLRVYKPSLCLY